MTTRRRILTWALTAVAAAAVAVAVVALWPRAATLAAAPTPTAVATTAPAPSITPAPSAVAVVDPSTLPEARYDAVIPGLVDVDGRSIGFAQVYSAAADVVLYDGPGGAPVARLAATDFLGEPTPVVVVAQSDGWGLALTPARRTLPSAATADQPPAAQSAGWVRTDGLALVTTPMERVVISTGDQTVSLVAGDGTVTASFPAAVGTADTPTPTGVVGYLEQRYVDPAQGTGDHPIQLTSLHSTVADEPYGGSDGGLIGVHYSDDRSGAISHGCIRIGEDAVAALSALPLGTLVVIE